MWSGYPDDRERPRMINDGAGNGAPGKPAGLHRPDRGPRRPFAPAIGYSTAPRCGADPIETRTSKIFPNLAMGAIVVAALAAGLVFGGMSRDDAADRLESGGPPQLERYEIGGEFELTNQRGERMRLSDLAGRALVMFFGYTFCPDVCPATLARVREVKAALAAEDAARFTGVLVSVDPARDTPQRLGRYVEFFDPGFVGLTGSEDEIEDVARRYGARFAIPEGQPEDGYLVNHSSIAYLIDPVGHVRALYHGDEPIEAIAANVREVLQELG